MTVGYQVCNSSTPEQSDKVPYGVKTGIHVDFMRRIQVVEKKMIYANS